MTKCIPRGMARPALMGDRSKDANRSGDRYVEMLEQQQTQLVNGLQELYKRVIAGQGWEGPPLNDGAAGRPLTHDILHGLGVLQAEGPGRLGSFDADLDSIQQQLLDDVVDGTHPRESSDSDSDQDSNPIGWLDVGLPRPQLHNPLATSQLPTPPLQSPSMHQNAPAWQPPEQHGPLIRPQSLQIQPSYGGWGAGLNPTVLHHPAWSHSPLAYGAAAPPVATDYVTGERLADYGGVHAMLADSHHTMAMPDWNELDFNSFLNAPMV